jgi:hypothetical protein
MSDLECRLSVDGDVLSLDWNSLRWFGVKLGRLVLKARHGPTMSTVCRASACGAQAFARDIKGEGLMFGVGIGQIGMRHLLYVGANNGRPHVSLGFCWLTPGRP